MRSVRNNDSDHWARTKELLMSKTSPECSSASDCSLGDEDFVTIAWLKVNGFKVRQCGPYRRLCYLLKTVCTQHGAVLCVSTAEMKHEFPPHLTRRDGHAYMYCLPRKRVTVAEVRKLIEAFAGE